MKVLQPLWNESSPRTINCLAYSNYSSDLGPPLDKLLPQDTAAATEQIPKSLREHGCKFWGF